ncbi:hypothetical protein EJ110_NYTH31538 [Nymphaea thermarum]|nr:hypothetical protein EJ110_NYTH31538 [Nymphaea thermarum]
MLGMNQETAGCSSGCESGWTMYLEHSVRAPAPPPCEIQDGECEEEDLSMVSDASSGPPPLQSEDVPTQNCRAGEQNGPAAAAANGSCLHTSSKRRRVQDSEHNPSSSDDTASSHLVSKDSVSPGDGRSMENFLDFSQGFSTTSFKVFSKFLQKEVREKDGPK